MIIQPDVCGNTCILGGSRYRFFPDISYLGLLASQKGNCRKLAHPSQQDQTQIFSAIGILVVFMGIIFLAWYALGSKIEANAYIAVQGRTTCSIGKLVRLNKVLRPEHSTTVNHFQVIYSDQGQVQTNCSFFSQFRFEQLEALALEGKRVCVLYDANKNNAVGIFRPRYHTR